MNQKLIEQLRQGKVILYCLPNEAEKILQVAFPEDICSTSHFNECRYFQKHPTAPNFYIGYRANFNNLPEFTVQHFLKEETTEFIWGEEIEAEVLRGHWQKGIYVGIDPTDPEIHIFMTKNGNDNMEVKMRKRKYIRKAPSVLELTLQEIADKFGKPVDQIRIKK